MKKEHDLKHKYKEIRYKEDKKSKKSPFFRKLVFFIVLTAITVVSYIFFKDQMIALLKMNPYLWNTYNHLAQNIGKNTWLGMLYMSIAGGLFFVPLSADIIFFYYLALKINPILVIVISIVGGLFGHIVDYLIGRMIGVFFLRKIMKEKFIKYSKSIENWGAFLLIPGNILPIPMDIISIFYGAFKFSFKKFLWLTLIGKTIKFVLFFLLGNYIVTKLFPMITSIKIF
jgi:membrane protein YqaA with SNARE-associated domain